MIQHFCHYELVKMQLIKSFCLPLLVYCFGALELSTVLASELSLCWNNAFRKIFHFHKWKSVKQYYCGCLDLKHIYDLYQWRFLSLIRRPYLIQFYASLELQIVHFLRFVFDMVLMGSRSLVLFMNTSDLMFFLCSNWCIFRVVLFLLFVDCAIVL